MKRLMPMASTFLYKCVHIYRLYKHTHMCKYTLILNNIYVIYIYIYNQQISSIIHRYREIGKVSITDPAPTARSGAFLKDCPRSTGTVPLSAFEAGGLDTRKSGMILVLGGVLTT